MAQPLSPPLPGWGRSRWGSGVGTAQRGPFPPLPRSSHSSLGWPGTPGHRPRRRGRRSPHRSRSHRQRSPPCSPSPTAGCCGGVARRGDTGQVDRPRPVALGAVDASLTTVPGVDRWGTVESCGQVVRNPRGIHTDSPFSCTWLSLYGDDRCGGRVHLDGGGETPRCESDSAPWGPCGRCGEAVREYALLPGSTRPPQPFRSSGTPAATKSHGE